MRPVHHDTSACLVPSAARRLGTVLGLIAIWSAPSWADSAGSCPYDQAIARPTQTRRAPALTGPVFVSANDLTALGRGVREFRGDVELTRGEARLFSQRLRYEQETGVADAEGQVQLSDTLGARYDTNELHFTLGTQIGYAGPGSFALTQPPARGEARRTEFDGPDRTLFKQVRFTTCPAGQDSWFLHSGELTLDTAEDLGTAYHAWVEFQGVPIFYFPYINFPISDRRKSGFLIPQAGYSDKRGVELATPYYFNLAPDYDDTLTPRLLSDRGLQLHNEFRHLGRRSTTLLDLEYLADDRVYGDYRAAGVFQHRNQLSRRWAANVDLRRVSDDSYVTDFRDSINLTSETHLPQVAEALYRGPFLNFSTRVTDYQTIDPTIPPASQPYARLPQLLFTTNDRGIPNRPRGSLEGEWVNFERDDSVTGGRLNLSAGVALPLANSYAFLTPRVLARGTQYALRDAPGDTDPSTTAGVFSLDSGLFFERDSAWGDRRYVQTLEPRIYYLYVPYRNQDAQPNFDTTLPDFSFFNLFRDNRFIGGDRIGDANQLSLAVSTRWLDEEDGAEQLRASLGQITYFADRQVGLPAGGSEPGPSAIGIGDVAHSNIVAELGARLFGSWYGQATVEIDERTHVAQRHGAYVQYQPARDRILTFGERYTRDQLRQTDVSAQWPLATRWTVIGRSLYSQRDHRSVESYAGLEYNACCWALRVFATQRFAAEENRQVNSVQLQLQLAGLSKLGSIPDSPLRQGLFFEQRTPEPTDAVAPATSYPALTP
jgi:LPS-assembly protein